MADLAKGYYGSDAVRTALLHLGICGSATLGAYRQAFINWAEQHPEQWASAMGFGRALELLAFDGRDLGDLFETLAPPLSELMLLGGMMVTRAEATQLLRADRSISAAMLALSLIARYLVDRIGHTRGTRLVLGNALVARLQKACLDQGVDVRRRVEVRCLRRETGRINGVELADRKLVAARRSVVLAGGGFPASASWRARELPEPVARHTPAAPSCVGRTIELATEVGGTLGPSGMDNALWFPSSLARRARRLPRRLPAYRAGSRQAGLDHRRSHRPAFRQRGRFPP
jgi:hypothetical protein